MNAAAIASIGIDLGKTVFHLVALDCHAGVIARKKFSRSQLLVYTEPRLSFFDYQLSTYPNYQIDRVADPFPTT